MRATDPIEGSTSDLPLIAAGTFSLYQVFEIGDAIDLEQARALLATPNVRRRAPPRVRQSESIEIAQWPLEVDLGEETVELAEQRFEGRLHASIYDLGAVALTFEARPAGPLPWPLVADLFAAAQDLPEPVERRFAAAIDELSIVIRDAIDRPRGSIVEDYSLLLVEQLTPPSTAEQLADEPLVRAALLGEQRPLSADASALVTAMSYYPDDLALLSWNGALVIEPDPAAAATVANLLEFANVELLLLRSYEADLDLDLQRLNQQILTTRGRPALPLLGRYTRLLHDTQRLVIDVTDVTARIDNAFKVTDDVYWNRLYSAALATLRVNVWRAGVDHRLALLRESYGILHGQVDSDRSASLEAIIILLILVEIVLAFVVY